MQCRTSIPCFRRSISERIECFSSTRTARTLRAINGAGFIPFHARFFLLNTAFVEVSRLFAGLCMLLICEWRLEVNERPHETKLPPFRKRSIWLCSGLLPVFPNASLPLLSRLFKDPVSSRTTGAASSKRRLYPKIRHLPRRRFYSQLTTAIG